MTTILYDIFLGILFLLYAPVLFLRGKWHDGFKERFGNLSPELKKRLGQKENIWIHAVSVGEVVAIEGFLRQLKESFPDKQVVLSITTKTGYALAQRKYAKELVLLWAPLDLGPIVRAFISAVKPVFYVAAETELWPNLFRALHDQKAPIFVVNGRISDQAYPRYRWVRWLLKGTLQRVTLFCMQSQVDAKRILSLGADEATVTIVGNIKFDNAPAIALPEPETLGFLSKDAILVGGSTHQGEEEILLDIYLSLKVGSPSLRLVLAPRHPERAGTIAELVRQKGLKPVLFSQWRNPLGEDDILVIDTIGHLLTVYALATVVFVGKSLTVPGGHNIIEPAVFGKPIVVGPHMENFRDITRAFLADEAVIQVENAAELKDTIRDLLTVEGMRKDLGARAKEVVRKNQGATRKMLALIKGKIA